MERKILCWICLLFTVAKCSLEHLQTLAVILLLIFQKYKADKTLQPKGHNIYLPWAASTADDAAFHFRTNRIWMTIKSRQGESYIQTELFSLLILLCNLTRIHSQIISQSNWSQHYYSKVISHYISYQSERIWQQPFPAWSCLFFSYPSLTFRRI